MCFTPTISLITAFVEFAFVAIMLGFFRKTVFRNFFAFFIFLLGLYQLSEFMLCTTNNIELWGRVGFMIYTFLPAVGLHGVLRFLKIKIGALWLYVLPVLFALAALLMKGFIVKGSCNGALVVVQMIFFQPGVFSVPSLLYWIYYFGFIFVACYLLVRAFFSEKNKIKREMDIIEVVGILLMTIPTVLIIELFPVLRIMFPSLLCKFAIFVAIAAFIGAYLENRLRR